MKNIRSQKPFKKIVFSLKPLLLALFCLAPCAQSALAGEPVLPAGIDPTDFELIERYCNDTFRDRAAEDCAKYLLSRYSEPQTAAGYQLARHDSGRDGRHGNKSGGWERAIPGIIRGIERGFERGSGGCNFYGCWGPGGGCNFYGCW